MIGLRGTTQGEPDKGCNAKAAEWPARQPVEKKGSELESTEDANDTTGAHEDEN